MDGHFHEPQTAAAVANEFIALARENSSKLTQMKLQKLVFYAHGWHLGLQKAPLIDEQVEAWPYGPVIPSLYSEFKSFGSKAITRFAQDVDEFGRVFIPRIRRSYDRNLIRRVWEEYGSFSAAQLSSLTHEPGAPWATAQKRNLYELKTFGIDNEVIKNFFEKVASKIEEKSKPDGDSEKELSLVKVEGIPSAGGANNPYEDEERAVELDRKRTARDQERTFPVFAIGLYGVWSAFVAAVTVFDGFHWWGFRYRTMR